MSDSGFVTILGVLIGAISGFWLSRHANAEAIRSQCFNQAAAEFRAEFTKEIRELRTYDDYDIEHQITNIARLFERSQNRH